MKAALAASRELILFYWAFVQDISPVEEIEADFARIKTQEDLGMKFTEEKPEQAAKE